MTSEHGERITESLYSLSIMYKMLYIYILDGALLNNALLV